MSCCANILNLIVGEGLEEIYASVARVHEAVRNVKSSPNRNQTFRSFMEMLGMESKSLLCLDVPTRWNSTYLILETAENFEKVFLRMDFEDDGYSSYFRTKEDSGGLGSPCMSDFQNCRAFVTFLRLFYNATKKFSGSLDVTSNAFFDEIFVIQEMGKVMVDKVKDFLMKLYTFYCSVNSLNVQEPSGSERTQMVGDASDPYVMVHSRYELFLEAEQSENSSRYPLLSKVAKDVLAVPVSNVAFESAFSTGGRIVDPFRSSLSPLMVQNLECAQN
ncbi:zinc finger BED domain-containing protein RICESLEEPER 2-like [Castanea sativa]|uniref:zinc finger BED domain-containing protein RICESLEEPER 2-like n=1 Tax=Castanea sativa TaxID=21020 RepID=UPI003F64FD2D